MLMFLQFRDLNKLTNPEVPKPRLRLEVPSPRLESGVTKSLSEC